VLEAPVAAATESGCGATSTGGIRDLYVRRRKERDEAHLPTQRPEACSEAWFPAQDVNSRRPGHHQGSPASWSRASVRLGRAPGGAATPPRSRLGTRPNGDETVPDVPFGRVSGRGSFTALRRSRRRGRSGPVAVHYEPALPADECRRVAYSVPRRVGRATERNRYRRQLRAVAREVASEVPPGAYLIGVEPGVRNVSFQELRRRVIEAMQRASGSAER